MAGRDEKHVVDFFPFFVKDGRTLFILESKYGCKGSGFFTNVMRFLCLTPDHHFCISAVINADRLYFLSRVHCDEESAMDMINIMAETGKINKELWLQKGVIYSPDLINSLDEAYRRRKNKPLNLDQIKAIYEFMPSIIPLMPSEIHKEGVINDDKNKQRKEKKRKEKNPLTPLTQIQQERFNRFWKSYPNKKSKGQAERTWQKIDPDEQLLATMIATIERAMTQDPQWTKDNGSFIPHPATWLNAKGWEDEIRGHQKHKQKNPFTMCSKCGEEYLETDIVDINGSMYCPKCPESREAFSGRDDRVKGLLTGIGRGSPGG